MRTIAVGDIHGCYRALKTLIKIIQPEQSDRLIFLGDYVDRGPDSRLVVDLLLDLQTRCQTVFLMGNHEIMFREVLQGAPIAGWLAVGGRETLASYGGNIDRIPERHQKFLKTLLPYFETEDHLFVHANYLPQLSLKQQPEEVLFWLHLSEYFPAPHHSGKHAVCGHTPQPDGKIGRFSHLTCLDTGCFSGSWLSAMDVYSGHCWQASFEGKLNASCGL